MNERLVFQETVVLHQCGSDTLKFGIKRVDGGQISTVKTEMSLLFVGIVYNQLFQKKILC